MVTSLSGLASSNSSLSPERGFTMIENDSDRPWRVLPFAVAIDQNGASVVSELQNELFQVTFLAVHIKHIHLSKRLLLTGYVIVVPSKQMS